MYKIIEPGPQFQFSGQSFDPVVTVEGEEKLYNIIFDDNKYKIFSAIKNASPFEWNIEVCIFDRYFIEVLRLLPENSDDLKLLNDYSTKELLRIWQDDDNLPLDKNLLELNDLTTKIEKEID